MKAAKVIAVVVLTAVLAGTTFAMEAPRKPAATAPAAARKSPAPVPHPGILNNQSTDINDVYARKSGGTASNGPNAGSNARKANPGATNQQQAAGGPAVKGPGKAETVVDAADLATWRKNTRVSGDYNADGRVDAADYVLWRNRAGNTAPPAGTP